MARQNKEFRDVISNCQAETIEGCLDGHARSDRERIDALEQRMLNAESRGDWISATITISTKRI